MICNKNIHRLKKIKILVLKSVISIKNNTYKLKTYRIIFICNKKIHKIKFFLYQNFAKLAL